MFEQASKLQLRFDSIRGLISTEDLWRIPLQSNNGFDIDTIAKDIRRELKENEDESFIVKNTDTNSVLELQFVIIKHIIKVRLMEIANNEQKEINRTKRTKLDSIIERKKDVEFESMSIEELEKMKEA